MSAWYSDVYLRLPRPRLDCTRPPARYETMQTSSSPSLGVTGARTTSARDFDEHEASRSSDSGVILRPRLTMRLMRTVAIQWGRRRPLQRRYRPGFRWR